MKEELISFETAKLAKEKGFYIPVMQHYYNSAGTIKCSPVEDCFDDCIEEIYFNFNKKGLPEEQCSAPTQSLLQRWLREQCMNKDISVIRVYGGAIGTKDGWHCILNDKSLTKSFLTYEDALEVGLLKALKLI